MPRTLVIPVLWQKLHLFCHDFIYNLLHTCEINTLALIVVVGEIYKKKIILNQFFHPKNVFRFSSSM